MALFFSPRPFSRALSAVLLLLAGLRVSPAQTPTPQITRPIDENRLVTLRGNVPRQATATNDRGATASNLPMNRMMMLLRRAPQQEQAFETRIDAMHDPKSPLFHQWLTPVQIGEQFGPAPEDIGKVSAWLASRGFSVTGVSNGRTVIEFSGDAGTVENAFHTSIHSYVVDGKTHFANATSPQIPEALAAVVAGVVSLHNFEKRGNAIVLGQATLPAGEKASKQNLKITPNSTNPQFTRGTLNATGPGDLWTIYNETPLIKAATPTDGKGQTIAIVGRSDIALVDFTGFRKNLLPAPYSTTVPLTQIHNGPDPGLVGGDQLENTLDVEYSSAMAPGAMIDLVVSGSTNSTDGVDLSVQYIVDNNLAPVVTTSYGLCEAGLGATENAFYNSIWQQAAAQGITSMVSSGDNGSAGCDLVGPSGDDTFPYVADIGLQVSGTASTPYNVAVGGTEFSNDTSTYWGTNTSTPGPFTSAQSFIPEMVWNESCSPLVCGNANANIAAGSGGASGCLNGTFDSKGVLSGCTSSYARPSWQNGVYGLPTDNKRHLPDISLNAAGHDGYMVCFLSSCNSGGFYIVGGTSASSPAFAGVMSLVNQATGSRQGQANYTLYSLAATQYGSPSTPNTAKLTSCNASNGNTVGSSCVFHDVTVGTNAVPCDGGMPNCTATTAGTFGVLTDYAATPGYDSATGLGSINIANLVAAWNTTPLTATTTSVTFGATTSTFGAPLALTAKVAGTSGTATPSGSVALLTDSTVPFAAGGGSVTLTNGSYVGTISSLPGGTYNVSGRYGGDSNFASSTSSTTQLTVNPAASSTAVTISATDPLKGSAITGSSFPYGSVVTGSVTVTGIAGQLAPVGTVVISSAGKSLASLTTATDGTAAYTLPGLPLASYSWIANYAGNNNYNGSTSTATPFSIVQASTVSRALTNTSYVVGTGTAKITVLVEADSFLANPTGTAALTINGAAAGTAPLVAYTDPATGVSGGTATFTVTASQLAAGKNSLAFSYSGDSNYAASTSPAISVGFSATAPVSTISLKASAASVAAQAPVTLTATVTTGGIPATAGTVNFYDGTALIGTAQVAGSAPAAKHTTGTATLQLQLAPGSHSIIASYLGIAIAPTKVTTPAVSVTVTGVLPTSLSLTAATNLGNNANYDLTGTVFAHGFTPPTATVDFSETSVAQDLGVATIGPASAKQTLGALSLFGAGDPKAAPAASAIADFNGDGIPDLVTANASFSDGTVSVMLGKGDGTFGAPTLYKSPYFSDDIQTADLNNDGVVDLVVTGNYTSSFGIGPVYVLLGNGDGTFQAAITVPQTSYGEHSAIADFNRDGVLDIATIGYYPTQVAVAFGNGDGTFQTPVVYPLVVKSFSAADLVAVDVNNDGAPDIVEANNNDNTTIVMLNNGDGTFTLGAPLATVSAQFVVAGDLNGDGKPDLVVSDYKDQAVTVLLGNGDGTFAAGKTKTVSGYPSSLALADMNHDGKLDLITGLYSPATNAVSVVLGNGDGTFGTETGYATTQAHGYGVTVGDLNGDGTPDVVSCDIGNSDSKLQNIAILLNLNQATATLSNVAVAGPLANVEQIQAVYAGDSNYASSVSAVLNLYGSGTRATPAILWQPAPTWGTGVPLGTAVLNATVSGQVAGTFTYTATPTGGSPTTVTAMSTLAAGTYTLTATFVPVDTANYLPATATRTLTIVTADFTMLTSTPSLTIAAGSTGTLTLTVPALYGFSGTVALSGSNLPGGFTFTASPASVAAGGTSTITIGTAKPLTAYNHLPAQPWSAPLTGGTVLACLAGMWLVRRRRLAGVILTALLAAAVTAGMSGCGGVGFQSATVGLTTASAKVASGGAVQLTATVSSKNSGLKGTVTFYNGNTVLGAPVTLANGTAAFTTSTLPVGLNSLTAVYSGDNDNSSATSTAVQQLITGSTSVQITGTAGSITRSTTVTVLLN